MKLARNSLSDAVRTCLTVGAVGTLGFTAAPVFAQNEEAQTLDRIEVTGSRVKRAAVEGALPVTVISREDIDLSGKVTVAELLQNSTFNSFGSFKPVSGSSAQSFSELSLRGLGGGRTLILIDGRRAPISPQTGEGQDLNTLPLAAVERIEILSDGASAIYGADAIGGVVNIITRRDFNGVEVSFGMGQSKRGGDTENGSVTFGTSSDRGRLLGGVSYASRGINYISDLEWAPTGGSSHANNFYQVLETPLGPRPGSPLPSRAVPGGCTNPGFYTNAAGTICYYDYNLVAADTASIDQKGAYVKGDYQITDDWTTYLTTSYTKVDSFGRFAPSLLDNGAYLSAESPNNPYDFPVMLKHRFAAAGPRDNFDQSDVHDATFGFNWQASDSIFVDFGIRRANSVFNSVGYNYIHVPTALALIESGEYNVANPLATPESVLAKIRHTTGRKSYFKQSEAFGLANFDLFQLAGGTAVLAVGAESRKEVYSDRYDQQSEAGNVGGSSGNSSFGTRRQESVYAELLLPFLSSFELDIAARYDDFSDYGSATTPKISLRWQPLDQLTFRASWGEGFRAPPLTILNMSESFSADSVVHGPTAVQQGQSPTSSIQINGTRVATPDLKAEESEQFALGVVWDPLDWLSLKLDYYNIELSNRITFYSAQTVINREDLGRYLPDNLYSIRDPETGALVNVRAGYGNEGLIKTDGYDFNAVTRFDLGNFGRLRNNLQVSYTNKYETSGPYSPPTDFVGTNDTPKWRAALTNMWEQGDFSLAWTVNAFDQTPSYTQELFTSFGYTYSCQDYVDFGYIEYSDSCKQRVYVTHDISGTWAAPWGARITLGALNLTNEKPRIDRMYTNGYAPELYDAYGRQVYIRYTQAW